MDPTDTAPRQAVADSFIHAARREQLVNSAIAVIADVGVERASVVQITRHAGVSRGVFAYHFHDIDDLLDAVVRQVYAVGGDRLEERVGSAGTARDGLLTFVGGSVQFYAEFPTHIAALRDIFAARKRSAHGSREADAEHGGELKQVEALLRAGQASGEFRAFDPGVMTAVVRAVLDTAIDRTIAGGMEPDHVAALAAELVAAIDAMTRAASSKARR